MAITKRASGNGSVANMPAGLKAEDTCLELYRRFTTDPKAFALEAPHD